MRKYKHTRPKAPNVAPPTIVPESEAEPLASALQISPQPALQQTIVRNKRIPLYVFSVHNAAVDRLQIRTSAMTPLMPLRTTTVSLIPVIPFAANSVDLSRFCNLPQSWALVGPFHALPQQQRGLAEPPILAEGPR